MIPGQRRRERPEWSHVDWPAHTREILTDGRRLRYVDFGRGEPLVLVHGLGGSWQNWLANIPALARSGFRVLAVDLPGFGQSDALPSTTSMSDLAEVLEGLLDRLELEQAVIVGHSLGGLVAMHFAQARPERTRGLVLVDGGALAIGQRRLQLIVAVLFVLNFGLGIPGVVPMLIFNAPLRRFLVRGMVGQTGSLTAQLAAEVIPAVRAPGYGPALRAAARAVHDIQPEQITRPTLVAWGERDRLVPPEEGRRLAREIAGAQLVCFPGVGHFPMFEAPESFNAVLTRFVNRLGPASSQRTGVQPQPVSGQAGPRPRVAASRRAGT